MLGTCISAAQPPCLAFSSARSAKVLCDTRHRWAAFVKDPRTSRLPPESERDTGTSSGDGTSNRIECSERAESFDSRRLSMMWLFVRIMATEIAARAASAGATPAQDICPFAGRGARGQRWAQAIRRVSIRCAPTAGQRSTAHRRAGCGVLDWRSLKCRKLSGPAPWRHVLVHQHPGAR